VLHSFAVSAPDVEFLRRQPGGSTAQSCHMVFPSPGWDGRGLVLHLSLSLSFTHTHKSSCTASFFCGHDCRDAVLHPQQAQYSSLLRFRWRHVCRLGNSCAARAGQVAVPCTETCCRDSLVDPWSSVQSDSALVGAPAVSHRGKRTRNRVLQALCKC